jgi:hypothetical protein
MSTDKKVTRLEDLEVHEVSVVDKGANKRTLLVVKNAGEEMPEQAELPADDDLSLRDDGTAIDDGDEDFGEPAPEVTEEVEQAADTDAVVEAQAVQAEADTSLVVSMDGETQTAFVEMLKGMQDRLGALGLAVEAAKPEPGAPTSLKLASEIADIAKTLGRLVGANKGEAIQALLGKTEAPSLTLDPSKMELTKTGATYAMPLEMAKPMVAEYAREMLYQACDSMYSPYDMEMAYKNVYGAMKAMGPFLTEDAQKQYAYNQPQPSYPAGVPDSKPPSSVKKGISHERLASLEGMVNDLSAQLKKANEVTEPAAPVTKSGDSELHGKLKKLVTLCKAQQAKINELSTVRKIGNAEPVGDRDEGDGQNVVWPDDLNELDSDV